MGTAVGICSQKNEFLHLTVSPKEIAYAMNCKTVLPKTIIKYLPFGMLYHLSSYAQFWSSWYSDSFTTTLPVIFCFKCDVRNAIKCPLHCVLVNTCTTLDAQREIFFGKKFGKKIRWLRYKEQVLSMKSVKEMDLLNSFSIIFSMGDNLLGLTFQYTKPLMKKGLPQQQRIFSTGANSILLE